MKYDIKKGMAKAQRLLKEADDLRASNGSDEDIRGKTEAFDAEVALIEQAKADEARHAAVAAADDDDSDADADGKSLRDHDTVQARESKVGDEILRTRAFWQHIENSLVPEGHNIPQGKTLSDRMRAALEPKSPKFKTMAVEGGVVAPEHIAGALMGPGYREAFYGKSNAYNTSLPQSSWDGTMQTIPADFRAMLLELPPEPPHILDYATVIPAPFGQVYWPYLVQSDADEYGGVTGAWIVEGQEKPNTEANVKQIQISTYEYAAYTELTNRLLSRSPIQLEPLVTRLFRTNVASALDYAFLVGSGDQMPLGAVYGVVTPPIGYVGQPLGITSDTTVRLCPRNKAGLFGYDDSVNIEHTIRSYHRDRCLYILNDSSLRSLKLEKDLYGRPLWGVSGGEPSPKSIQGYPFVGTYRLPAVGGRGDVVFGDWSQYIVAMEQEVVVQSSPHYKFKNNVMAFRVSIVCGGRTPLPRAFAILDNLVGSTTNSPYAASTTPFPTTTAGPGYDQPGG
jgi:HK97 family phage major capsid protein